MSGGALVFCAHREPRVKITAMSAIAPTREAGDGRDREVVEKLTIRRAFMGTAGLEPATSRV
jgi:hypothetical protein